MFGGDGLNKMAMKDWKKTYESETSEHWQNYKKIDWLFIQKDGKYWNVENLSYGGRTTILKEGFKTKSQALAYARSYMRSH